MKIKDAQLKYGLSDSQIHNITEQFNRYDLDNDGRIGKTTHRLHGRVEGVLTETVPAEVKELLMKIQLDATESAVSAFIQEMDKDENGSIELWEVGQQLACLPRTALTTVVCGAGGPEDVSPALCELLLSSAVQAPSPF